MMPDTEKIEFKATLQMLLPLLLQTVMDKKKLAVEDAVKMIYSSRLYEDLENEKTKLWHLSPLALSELLEQELTTGKIEYPEET